MICEDNPDLLQVYKLALRTKYDVVGVASGKECLRKYADLRRNGRQISALLLDYRLPDATGDEVAMKLKELDGTRVILISAYEIDDHLVNAMKLNGSITLFIKKPISIASLGQAIDSVLSM